MNQKHLFSVLGYVLLGVLSFEVQASGQKVKVGTEIKPLSYIEKCDCLGIELVNEPAVGPNFATVASLAQALMVDGGSTALRKNIKKIEGKKIVLKMVLPLISDEEALKMGLD